ncbi:hypothetical protein RFI_07662 [Reticulomyxa filosa]|uniref:Uncharacterized protein n=1 Tax=Reticulomyxa filosa TaxID=46433 RepID=X6NT61_RETFI|nr:hypothetical protein RFI_07662 [Reticulomyxa filosa]|eukprot:ETO29460.1 hypothetical protein RFI_07662 [Reticulomyxa filosa]
MLNCTKGCLFDVVNDMTEHNDISSLYPEIVHNMSVALKQYILGFYSNDEIGENACPHNITEECACWMAHYYWNGFFGPYQFFNIYDNSTPFSNLKFGKIAALYLGLFHCAIKTLLVLLCFERDARPLYISLLKFFILLP